MLYSLHWVLDTPLITMLLLQIYFQQMEHLTICFHFKTFPKNHSYQHSYMLVSMATWLCFSLSCTSHYISYFVCRRVVPK